MFNTFIFFSLSLTHCERVIALFVSSPMQVAHFKYRASDWQCSTKLFIYPLVTHCGVWSDDRQCSHCRTIITERGERERKSLSEVRWCVCVCVCSFIFCLFPPFKSHFFLVHTQAKQSFYFHLKWVMYSRWSIVNRFTVKRFKFTFKCIMSALFVRYASALTVVSWALNGDREREEDDWCISLSLMMLYCCERTRAVPVAVLQVMREQRITKIEVKREREKETTWGYADDASLHLSLGMR